MELTYTASEYDPEDPYNSYWRWYNFNLIWYVDSKHWGRNMSDYSGVIR